VLSNAWAQSTSISPPTGQKTLAATLNVYAFPGAGQVPTQQSQDETECYNWAVGETGNDPFHISSKPLNSSSRQPSNNSKPSSQRPVPL